MKLDELSAQKGINPAGQPFVRKVSREPTTYALSAWLHEALAKKDKP